MEWRRLNQSDGLSFNEYAAFLLANPGWPGEERMRKTAEGAINLLSYSTSNVTAYFAKYPPLSNSGWARDAVALASRARPGEARKGVGEGQSVTGGLELVVRRYHQNKKKIDK